MKVFVTGATGFIGSHVVELLLKKGYEVSCLTRKTSNLQWLNSLSFQRYEGSLDVEESLYGALKGVDMVFHVGGLTAARNRQEFFTGNQIGTRNLLRAVQKMAPDLKRFLHVSSLAAVGPAPSLQQPVTEETPYHPITAYGESKRAAEEEVFSMQQQLPVTIVRPPAVYGPRDTGVLTFFQTVNKGIAPLIGFSDKYVSLVHSDDLARGIVEAAESHNTIGQAYFISSDRFYSWAEVGDVTVRALGKKRFLKLRIPHPFVMTVAGISEFFGKFLSKPPILNYEKGKDIIQPYWICSTEKASRDFGYRQEVSLEQGVAGTIEWCSRQGWL